MQLTTDLPLNSSSVRYIETHGAEQLPPNTKRGSAENTQCTAEPESTEELAAYLDTENQRLRIGRWVVGVCTECRGNVLNAPFLSSTRAGSFCSRSCRDQTAAIKPDTRKRTVVRHFATCLQCAKRFLPARANQQFCRTRCRIYHKRSLTVGPCVTPICQAASTTRINIGD